MSQHKRLPAGAELVPFKESFMKNTPKKNDVLISEIRAALGQIDAIVPSEKATIVAEQVASVLVSVGYRRINTLNTEFARIVLRAEARNFVESDDEDSRRLERAAVEFAKARTAVD